MKAGRRLGTALPDPDISSPNAAPRRRGPNGRRYLCRELLGLEVMLGGWGSASLLLPAPAGLTGTVWLRIHRLAPDSLPVFTPRHGGRLPRRKPAWKRGKEPRISRSCSAPKAKLLLLLSGLLMPVLLLMELAPLGLFSPLAGGRAVVCHEG